MDMELKSIDMERDMSSWRERLCLALLEFVLPHSETWAEASERNERQMMVDFIVVMYWYWGCGFANECDVMRLEIEFYNGDPQAGTRSLSSYLFSQRNFFLIRATDELGYKNSNLNARPFISNSAIIISTTATSPTTSVSHKTPLCFPTIIIGNLDAETAKSLREFWVELQLAIVVL
jgi:hypothetical protein